MAKKEFIEAAYLVSKKFYFEKLPMQNSIDELSALGMNSGSAFINISTFRYLMDGERFTRTLTAATFDYFLQSIFKDFGPQQLSVCLNALSQHIEYFEEKRSFRMGLVREVHRKYTLLLTEPSNEDVDEEEALFPEGREKFRLHRFKERSRKLVGLAKERHKRNDPKMRCQICKFSFGE